MKITRNDNDLIFAKEEVRPHDAWKLLVVDDDPDILAVTRFSLDRFTFHGRPLHIIEAGSGSEARMRLAEHDDIALALIDVVMETEDAGLRLVDYIRNELGNRMIRLVIRTGQPGSAPERFVIDHFDIDDYKEKTEVTSTRLYTSIRSGLKAYRDLKTISANRAGLEQILNATPELFRVADETVAQFFSGVLAQVIALCNLTHSSQIGTFEGIVATFDPEGMKVQARTSRFDAAPEVAEIHAACLEALQAGNLEPTVGEDSLVLPLTYAGAPIGYIYVEPVEPLSEDDLHLLKVLARQSSQALENFRLHRDLVQSFDNAVDMLAEIAEFKDRTTGGHINRIDRYTTSVALAMGVSEAEARRFGKASRLHDVGKIGIADHILCKPGKLTADEFRIIQTHTTIGASILAHDGAFELARGVALHHHERWDGTGYPDGIRSSELPLVNRIVSVVDVFDALVCRRPYKEAWLVADVRRAIVDGAGTQFDPAVVDAFIGLLDRGEFDDVLADLAAQATDRP
jgi:response regulator RpfG family c-di-GMP phosphodiesterase